MTDDISTPTSVIYVRSNQASVESPNNHFINLVKLRYAYSIPLQVQRFVPEGSLSTESSRVFVTPVAEEKHGAEERASEHGDCP